MKNSSFTLCLLVLTLAGLTTTTFGQVQSVAAAHKQPSKSPATDKASVDRTSATRARVLGQNSKGTPPAAKTPVGPTNNAHAKTELPYSPNTGSIRTSGLAVSTPVNGTTNRARTVSNTTAKPTGSNSISLRSTTTAVPSTPIAAAPGQIYRIGVRDVLDIQLKGQSGKQSTLFTVIDGGFLEFPLAGGQMSVAGLTTAEVAALLRQRIKILDNPEVMVNVRDYASHPVTITGLVTAPGVKNLRREAVPLYTILAEALMLPEAARVTITRQGREPILVDLKDSKLGSTPVLPGDIIKVAGMPAGPTEFFFVGGEINSPGQKAYHAGVTLTQAILASGGTTRNAGSRVRVSRQGTDGRLINEEYNLRKIQEGKKPDPVLQEGDRIEVSEDR